MKKTKKTKKKKEPVTSYGQLTRNPALYEYVLKRKTKHDRKTVNLADKIKICREG